MRFQDLLLALTCFIFLNSDNIQLMQSSSLSEQVQLFLSCRNLKDLDIFSKSDPYVKIMFRQNFMAKQLIPLGRTETVKNDLNPTFSKSFIIDYQFEMKQDINFEVYDDDGGDDDYIGKVETTVGALMGAKNQTSILDLKKEGKSTGKLIVRGEKVGAGNEYIWMKIKGVKLMNTDSFFDFWDKSDPYLKLVKIRNDNTFLQVHRTQKIMDNLNPAWKPFQIQTSRLLNDQGTFRLECWDWEQSGKDQFIGEQTLSMAQLASQQKFPFQIILSNPKHKKPGKLHLQEFKVLQKPSFLDYLKGGMQLNMIIAIDFTASNGNPHNSNSLHYMNPNQPNQYQLAISAVTDIMLHYDSDKKIPALGFGGQIRYPDFKDCKVNHCFPLSGNPNQSQAMGMEHLMGMYADALKNITLSGPTYFGPIIRHSMNIAQNSKKEGSRTYQTLLILTDGQIHDMRETIDLLINATCLPLSVIIVGVGTANFQNMVQLDGDNGLFDSKGRKAQRDIVQFVPFREVNMSKQLLAKQLLAELPSQVVNYMGLMNIPPGKPQATDIDAIAPKKNYGNIINKVIGISENPF